MFCYKSNIFLNLAFVGSLIIYPFKETKSHLFSQVDFEIQNEYREFKGCDIPEFPLHSQPCLAVQFVYSLQQKLKENKDVRLAEKMAFIIGRGVGVGGISERQATKEEHKLLFSALYQISDYEIDKECVSLNTLYGYVQDSDRENPYEYKAGLNQLITQTMFKVRKENNNQLQSLIFLKDDESYNTLIRAITYKISLPLLSRELKEEVGRIFKENKIDKSIAVKSYKTLSKTGSAEAGFLLGNIFLESDVVAKDVQKASKYLKQSAQNGHKQGQYIIGINYLKHHNYEEGIKWLTYSAEQGHQGAQSELGLLYLNGQYVSENEKKAIELLEKSSIQGNARAIYYLGLLHQIGHYEILDDTPSIIKSYINDHLKKRLIFNDWH